jgi:hypothetical protein
MKLSKKDLTDIPLLALVAANLLPLWGVCFLKWDAFHIIVLYWSENLAIGFYNVLKIAAAKVSHPVENLAKLFLIPFFIVHYGGFMAVHGFFVLAFAQKTQQASSVPSIGGHSWPCFLVFVQLLINVIRQMFSAIPSQMRYAVLALFVSHGVSFVHNYLLKGEYKTAKPGVLMGQPYARVVVLHIALLAGGFLTMALRSPVPLLFVLVVGKIILDIKLHLRERQKAKPLALAAATSYTGQNENISNTCSPQ